MLTQRCEPAVRLGDVVVAEDRGGGDEERHAASRSCAMFASPTPPSTWMCTSFGQRARSAVDAAVRLLAERLPRVAGMDAHAEDDVRVRSDAGDVLRLALRVERDAGPEPVRPGGGDRARGTSSTAS